MQRATLTPLSDYRRTDKAPVTPGLRPSYDLAAIAGKSSNKLIQLCLQRSKGAKSHSLQHRVLYLNERDLPPLTSQACWPVSRRLSMMATFQRDVQPKLVHH